MINLMTDFKIISSKGYSPKYSFSKELIELAMSVTKLETHSLGRIKLSAVGMFLSFICFWLTLSYSAGDVVSMFSASAAGEGTSLMFVP